MVNPSPFSLRGSRIVRSGAFWGRKTYASAARGEVPPPPGADAASAYAGLAETMTRAPEGVTR